MTVPMRRSEEMPAAGTVEDVLIRGNLSDLKPEQRTEYYMRVCRSVGLNPLTRPFEYLTLNGKLTLYARRDCADQLRKINGISIEIVSQDRAGDMLSVHVRAKDKDGRTDEDLGVVSLPQNLKGEAAANAILKAVTKAKRRVTLSISGLGFLDETEVEDIPASAKSHSVDVTPAPKAIPALVAVPVDPETGEVRPHAIAYDGDPIKWGSQFVAALNAAEQVTDLAEWQSANNATLGTISEEAPKVSERLEAAIKKRFNKLNENILVAG
jgi:hypothetical protein